MESAAYDWLLMCRVAFPNATLLRALVPTGAGTAASRIVFAMNGQGDSAARRQPVASGHSEVLEPVRVLDLRCGDAFDPDGLFEEKADVGERKSRTAPAALSTPCVPQSRRRWNAAKTAIENTIGVAALSCLLWIVVWWLIHYPAT